MISEQEQKRELFEKVKLHFNDKLKAALWFKTPNPAFGNISPNELIELGRIHKVKQFIDAALEGY